MQHYRPHPSATFEGYYSKFHLSSGSHIALVICSVPRASQNRHLLSFTYYPGQTSDGTYTFQREVFLRKLTFGDRPADQPNNGPILEFKAEFEYGSMQVDATGRTVWNIHHPDFTFTAATLPQTETPWLKPQLDTPEGLLVHLPLPLHWHVQSLATKFTGTLHFSDNTYSHALDIDTAKQIQGLVHQEKNWAKSFPSAHIWIQARKSPLLAEPQRCADGEESGLCLAGGQTIGTNSYLLAYHSAPAIQDSRKRYNLTTRPPFSTEITLPGLRNLTRWLTNLFTKSKIDYPNRRAELSFFCPSSYPSTANTRPLSHGPVPTPHSLSNRLLTAFTTFIPCLPPYRYITIDASAPRNSFFSLTAPFADGHRPNFLAQSFRATISVNVFELEDRVLVDFGYWLGLGRNKYVLSVPTHWRKLHEETFDNGSLEFGADWYDDRSEHGKDKDT